MENSAIVTWCPLAGRSGHEAAWELLEQTYRQQTGEDLPDITYGKWGKPDFAQGPWHFSLAHTPRHAFCALAKHPVGIDAEELDRPIRLALAEKILSPGEQARFAAAPDPRRALLTLWVLKEAQAKQTGRGLRLYPNHTDFFPADPRVQELAGCLIAVVE